MHKSIMAWAAQLVATGLAGCNTLEIGAINVNGSLRELFTGHYVGVDLRPGPGVDQVANGHNLPFPDKSFGVVVCTETLSHDPAFWLTLAEITRVLKRGGHLLLTVRGYGFGRNDSPCDYYRFTAEAVASWLARDYIYQIEADLEYPGVLAHGWKERISHD